ncbi:MAG: RidA family protein [Thermomicrobiales bacterium]|nr:RidA family protein [Thermomicrobiales bacterium]MCO5228203.1 RidA family protein [Thermomicrobiales bacterium]
MSKKIVLPARPGALFSRAVQGGGLVFLSGHVAGTPEQVDPNDIRSQTRGTFQNIARTLGEAGLNLGDVVRVTVYLTNIDDKPGMDEIYREFFITDTPARSTVAINSLAGNEFLIEVDIVAVAKA